MSSRSPGIAAGADGAGLMRRLYRRSPLRRLVKIDWAHRGITERDVFLASYPRSGSAWLRFLLFEMTAGDASFEAIGRAVPYVGRHRAAPALLADGGRIIKTHEPFLGCYRRAIHLVRDPRDVVLSYFGFMQRIGKLVIRPADDERASLDRFIDSCLAGRVDAHGTWQTHVLSWRAAADARASDILAVRYEDLRSDPVGGVRLMAEWLGVMLSAERAADVVERCSLERMRSAEAHALAHTPKVFSRRARASDRRVVNDGRVAGWRTALDAAQQRRFAVFADGLELMGYPPADGTQAGPSAEDAA